MKKIDKIDGCHHCPLRSLRGFERICSHQATEGNIIKIQNIIQEWCPLPEDDDCSFPMV